MGCLFAQDQGWQHCAQQAIAGIGPPPGPFSDLTLPMVSIVKSERLCASVCRTFGDEQLEDAWIPCFVVATNLTRMRKTVFSQGDVWQAALASVSPPAVAKPRIIRGELLCDGGLIENLPVSVLLEQECRYIIASNIATELNLSLDAPDFPNPWGMLFDRLFRQGQATADVPSAIDILLASTTLASEDNRQAMTDFIDVNLAPNLKGFKPTDFKRSSELVAQGFVDACAQIAHHRSAKGPDSEFWRIIHESAALPWPCADADSVSTL
jgi:predicted acylesterase/phospholipase RssA